MLDLFGQDAVMDAFTGIPEYDEAAPLAVRMRPTKIEEVLGQAKILEEGSPLRRLIEDEARTVNSIFLWGPPGTGKTTIAYLLARATNRNFVEISAVSAGVKELREVIQAAKNNKRAIGKETILFVDEVHRFSKSQQDSLLPAVENRWVTLVAATTENPSFSVIAPLLSRSLLLVLEAISSKDIKNLLQRALADERGLKGEITASNEALDQLVRLAGGDARKSLTLLEASAGSLKKSSKEITIDEVNHAAAGALVRYDKAGDQHYDVISAFIKSVRGSDVNAALHYLARMIAAGEDPRFIARRLIILAAEDIGLADPTCLLIANAAADAVQFIGMPEGRIPLSEATIRLALAPKSNSAYLAIDEALEDVRKGNIGLVPPHLRGSNYVGAEEIGSGVGYKYAHDYDYSIAPQQYLPDELVNVEYYSPTQNGQEKKLSERYELAKSILEDS